MSVGIDTIGRTAVAQVDAPVPKVYLHCALFLARNRLLGAETFQLVRFDGQESVSNPFEYHLELRADTDPAQRTLTFEQLIGRPVTVGLAYASEDMEEQLASLFRDALRGASAGDALALFNGIVTAFSMEQPGVYKLTMAPALWRMSLTNAYAIHRRLSIRDAIARLLERHRIPFNLEAVEGRDNPAAARVQDWLQAGETDLDFLRRLMGKANMYYYFVHGGTSHQLVFANRPETPYPPVLASGKPLRYTWTGADDLGMTQSDVISQYSYQRTLTSSAVRAVLARQEAAWEADPVAHFQAYHAASREDVGELPFNRYKIYQYGGSRDEAQVLSDATSSAMQAAAVQFSGSSYCPMMRVGHQFTVTGADSAAAQQPVRPTLEGQRFVLTQVSHEASADGTYRNQFQSTEAGGFIAAFSVQETQQGVILAQVVAKSGGQDTQDWRYYTANYFDPETNTLIDRGSEKPELAAMGVYVRFSTDPPDADPVWVKLAPHMQTVPEIGVTVLVTRASDESELPEIQSTIQANGAMTIQPSTWMANTHVGSNYSTNYGDSQSIRFGKNSSADLNRAASITGTAYATGKYRDTSYSQGASYSFSVSEATAKSSSNPSELWGPYGGAPDLLNASESFGSSYSRSQAQVSSNSSQVGVAYNKSLTGMSESHSVVGMHQNTSATGISTSTDVTLATTSAQMIGTTTSTQLIGSSNSTQMTGSSSGLSLTGMSDQVSISGTSNGIGLTGSQWNLSLTGESTSFGATGTRTSGEAVGASSSMSLTGSSDSVSITGSSSSMSVTGSSTSMSLQGATNNTSLTGSTTEFSITGSSDRNSVIGVATGATVYGMYAETQHKFAKSEVESTGAETTVRLTNGVVVTSASGRVNTEMSGPDINMPAIKIIM